MAQQTAVDWYYEQTVIQGRTNYAELLEQAKQMQKQQQKYFFECGRNFQLTGENTFEQCYNETYGKE